MRRIAAAITALLLTLALTACNREPAPSSEASSSPAAESTSAAGNNGDPTAMSPTDSSGNMEVSGASNVSGGIIATTGSRDKTTKPTGGGNTTATSKAVTSLTQSPAVPNNPADKPTAADPGALYSRVPSSYKSAYDGMAKTMREKIRSAKDTVKATGTTYYVSPNGNDANNGKSPQTAWQTLAAVSNRQVQFRSGDAVLLERGGVYRYAGSVKLANGVYYGAYGTGDKPCIYGSTQNYVQATWKNQGGNIWMLDKGLGSDVGLVVFNHGEQVGWKRSSKSALTKNYDFYSDKSNGYRVYLYLDKDPSKSFTSIEIGADNRILLMDSGAKDITIENLTIKYTGAHAIRGSNCSHITVRNCEIGYVGGSILSGYGNGSTRYGNGIEFMSDSQNVLIENCWLYQIYDSGVTHQGDGNFQINNFVVKDCLIEYCGMGSIEYWHTKGAVMGDILYTGNLLRYAGYGFGGEQRPDKEMTAHIESNGKPTGSSYNEAIQFRIENNIFELSTYQLVNAVSAAGTPPTLSGNTYVQWKGKWLGYYGTNSNKKFNDSVLTLLQDTWGDKTAKVSYP